MRLPSFSVLAKAGTIGGLASCFAIYIFQKGMTGMIMESTHYKEALEILNNNEKVVKYLGEPVTSQGKRTTITMESNTGKISIPIRGSNTTGKLQFEVVLIKDPEPRTELTKVRVQFDNIADKSFILMQKDIAQ